MKKIIFSASIIGTIFLSSCNTDVGSGGGNKYTPVNRKNAIFMVDNETGEVFMMTVIAEKGKGVTGSKWKKMGDPSMAK